MASFLQLEVPEQGKIRSINQEAEPLFYGPLPTESKEMDYVLSCALECCKELSIEYNMPDVQDITVSGWVIEQPFNVVILGFDDLHLKDNFDLKAAVYTFIKTILLSNFLDWTRL